MLGTGDARTVHGPLQPARGCGGKRDGPVSAREESADPEGRLPAAGRLAPERALGAWRRAGAARHTISIILAWSGRRIIKFG